MVTRTGMNFETINYQGVLILLFVDGHSDACTLAQGAKGAVLILLFVDGHSDILGDSLMRA